MPANLTNPSPRVIVLCFDGTGDQFSNANTNVVKLYSILDRSSPLEQTAYYQPGVGTYIKPGVVSPVLSWIAKKADEGFAWYLNDHVMEGYKFLMQNYQAGDKICLFGFSRGAYTARALAGFLYKIGLLLPDNDEQVPFAYELYKRAKDDKEDPHKHDDGVASDVRPDIAADDLAAKFKRTFCTPVTIDFLGVWDTVASVGVVYGRGLPFTTDNRAVRIFRHALSLDEHRARFQPNQFHRETPQDAARRKANPSLPVRSESILPDFPPVQEVWFAGCHSDVGGSSVKDTVRPSLSNISLHWMVKQVILSGCRIKFDIEAMRRVFIDESIIRLISPEGRLEVEDEATLPTPQTPYWEHDVSAGIHDELWLQPAWWLVELLLTRYVWQDPEGRWKYKWGFNLGYPREVRDLNPNFHHSVKKRIELNQHPKAKWTRGTEQYVD